MNLREKWLGLKAIWRFDNRFQLLLNRLFFPKTGTTVYRFGGKELVVDHKAGDQNGTRMCLATDNYAPFVNVVRDIWGARPIRLLDLGANGGGFPLLLERSGMRLDRVVAVEMNPTTAARLALNLSNALDARFQVINAAVCGSARTLRLHLGRGSLSDSIHGAGTNAENPRLVEIDGRTFDDLFQAGFCAEQRIELCKMDVEGAEHEILSSHASTRLSCCGLVIMEIHGSSDDAIHHVITAMRSRGFHLRPETASEEPNVRLFSSLPCA